MRLLKLGILVLITLVFTGGLAMADGDGERKCRKKDRRAKLIEKFDADGDGKLNEEERAAAREHIKAKRGKDGKHGDRHKKRRARILKKFDADGDGKLNE